MGETSNLPPMIVSFGAQELSRVWTFRQKHDRHDDKWMPVKRVPSTVHQDLLDNGRIEDPFVGFNESKAEWVGTKTWTYRTRIPSEGVAAGTTAVLAFDGLDTFANVRLDGQLILQSDNMFLPYRVDVTHYFLRKSSEPHVLEIEFDSALLRAREIQRQHSEHKYVAFNGETSRLCVRKTQYHWGWDWGPFLMCAGIWRPVRLETYSVRISDLRIDNDIATDYKSATISASIETEGYSGHDVHANFTVALHGKVISTFSASVGADGRVAAQLYLDEPDLWMPNGYGEQTMYQVDVQISTGGLFLHKLTRQIGLRRAELVQRADSHGKSFFFRVNGVDIFCGGSCWIPADIFLTNVTRSRYRAWLELMVPANQKMIRVWGGGIYEDDAFYDICDELGILVWQDFMFACGNYPCFPEMLKSVETEATANVRRLRHHPSIVMFAGNNEDYQVQEQAGLTYDYGSKDETSWLKSDFPARYIYEALLPRVMSREAPLIPYHPGSPWGDGKVSSDPTVGDMHQWNVWHGTQEKYQIFDTLGGRFNSEFGMEAFPHIATIRKFVEREEDLYPQSHVMDFHNKADGHERRLATYLVENVRTATDLKTHTYLTQLIQSEALMFGYRGWRKQWGEDRHCGGALVWQLNDCWPVTSWSIIDYYMRRKASYYTLARVLAPIAVGVRRKHHDWSVTHARDPETQAWELWAVSSLRDVEVDIELRFISIKTGKDIRDKLVKRNLKVEGNGTTEVFSGYIDNVQEEAHVLAARLWVNGKVVARDCDWPQPLKYLPFPERNVKVEVDSSGTRMCVTVDRPVKCLVFEEREGCHLSDSALDLLPGDPQVVTVRGLQKGDKALDWTYLGAGEQ